MARKLEYPPDLKAFFVACGKMGKGIKHKCTPEDLVARTARVQAGYKKWQESRKAAST